MIDGIRPSRPARRHLVAVVAFDGVVLGDLSVPCEIFGRVRGKQDRPVYDVRVCSGRRHVRSAHVTLDVPWRLQVLQSAETVFVPGIEDLDREIPDQLLRALRTAIRRGARVASICTGAFVLAQTGALDGRTATTHWQVASELARRYPGIIVDANVLFVDHGSVLTSAGAAAGLDLCLHIVRSDLGAEAAARVARAAVMPLERAGGQAQFIVHEPPTVADATFGPLLFWIESHLRADLSLSVLARRAAMSVRTLSRRFRKHVGTTPGDWVVHARLGYARRLLETTQLSIEAIAESSGFGSATVLRDRFRAALGTSPVAYRRSFQARP